jgi:hypothetical protein
MGLRYVGDPAISRESAYIWRQVVRLTLRPRFPPPPDDTWYSFQFETKSIPSHSAFGCIIS